MDPKEQSNDGDNGPEDNGACLGSKGTLKHDLYFEGQ